MELKYPNGDFYKGTIYRGKEHGRGSFYYNNGDIYEGQWKDG